MYSHNLHTLLNYKSTYLSNDREVFTEVELPYLEKIKDNFGK